MMEKEKYKTLMELAKNDPNYQACLEEVRRWEPAYLALRESPPDLQKRSLENYISACKGLDHAMLRLALKKD